MSILTPLCFSFFAAALQATAWSRDLIDSFRTGQLFIEFAWILQWGQKIVENPKGGMEVRMLQLMGRSLQENPL